METTEVTQKNKLIVLLPESLAGSVQLAYKIYSMAAKSQQDVLFLVMLEEKSNYLEYSRHMATMKAATSGKSFNVSYKLSDRNLWLIDLRQAYQTGDVVLCQAEQSVRSGFMRTTDMLTYLQDTLKLPAVALSGFYDPQREQLRQWMYGLLFWVSALAILAAFLFLEIKIEQDLMGTWRTVLLILAIVLEFGVFTAVNRIPKI